MTPAQMVWTHVMLQMRLANEGKFDRAMAEHWLDRWFERRDADLMKRQADGQTTAQPKI